MEGYCMYQAKILIKEGMSRQGTASALGVTRRTIYNYEHGKVFQDGVRRGRPTGHTKLSGFYPYVDSKLGEDLYLNCDILFDRLIEKGYSGKISILRDYVQRKRKELENYAIFRFETLPGQQAQVDWADVGYCLVNGQYRKRYAFVMKLGFSRRSYTEFTLSMDQSVLFACMIRAFIYFGGIPREILFDNMKTAFLFDGQTCHWKAHPRMLAFADHYGFAPKRCRVRRPKTKGKVEREIRYLKHSFFPALHGDRSAITNQRLNELVLGWLMRVDTKPLRELNQSRAERFVEDARHLQGLPEAAFDYRKSEPLMVGGDGRITFETNRYSVPAQYRGIVLQGRLDITAATMTLYHEGKEVRLLGLQPAGARKTVDAAADRADHLRAWEEGRDAEERRMRLHVERKKLRAQQENVIVHPSVYDALFAMPVAFEAQAVAL